LHPNRPGAAQNAPLEAGEIKSPRPLLPQITPETANIPRKRAPHI
jgi:hypothetical protein